MSTRTSSAAADSKPVAPVAQSASSSYEELTSPDVLEYKIVAQNALPKSDAGNAILPFGGSIPKN